MVDFDGWDVGFEVVIVDAIRKEINGVSGGG